ncbi:uncharacterized protein FOMMEDRAFT_26503 [Fomitiporia mediterranea MF3/22]|uniref:uncharacterized protein n=1 Tax=Fomitiporia mediterranea (strain MF3/22) TaxID=694068 RepID=UPI0004408C9F|nr:uncharacterized protein FOMMEDRAFT_26503 [Fomitiporia mediterranea MF3/22]EJD05629.1 hypothetical protein FOMMEDRAFT_26503 [Fomitiporia mediterranea MF3/22]
MLTSLFIHSIKDLQMAALTGGRTGLEPALVQYQVELCLQQGEIYVAGQDNNVDAVLLAYAPGQDTLERPHDFHVVRSSSSPLPGPLSDYLSKLSPEMQQWWTAHVCCFPLPHISILANALRSTLKFQPKFSELTNMALGSQEGRKAAWYIKTIAVHPDKQRSGIARQLLETVLKKANASGRKACLEVNNDSMVRFFSKFGFRVRATKNFGSYQGGFILFLMTKDPARYPAVVVDITVLVTIF